MEPRPSSARPLYGALALILVVIAGGAAALAYTAGWFSPQQLTGDRIVDAFKLPPGAPLGHRRNHAKGICFTGVFDATGAGTRSHRLRFSSAASIRPSGASISALLIRTRRMGRSECGAWDYGSRRRTGRNGAAL